MAVLLKDAIMPNLVQTLENNPAFIHGGPFANIAHGCNSVIATKSALKLADYVVTEAGFGADLGAEKFFDIKCRKAGLKPAAAVVVATIRALKMHGGVARGELGKENVAAVKAGLENLGRHLQNIAKYGVPAVVAINRFNADTAAEMAEITAFCDSLGVSAFVCSHWADGGAGTEAIARKVVELADGGSAEFKPLYADALPLWDKIDTVSREIYRADGATAEKRIRDQVAQYQEAGYGHFPVCMAKTQYSFSTDPDAKGAPTGFEVPVREVRLSAGAEFIVAICGEIMTMPGLPRVPAAENIYIDEQGRIEGLF
jgi:formate--tetrahydrofolate ligase